MPYLQRENIIGLLEQGMSQRDIADGVDVTQGVRSKAYVRYQQLGTLKNRTRLSCQKLKTPCHDGLIVRVARRNPTFSNPKSGFWLLWV